MQPNAKGWRRTVTQLMLLTFVVLEWVLVMDCVTQSFWISLCIILSVIVECLAVPMTSTVCGACAMVVTEMEIMIAELEEKKQRKYYHLPSGTGNQDFNRPSSRSESQLSEILENVCDKSSEWTAVIHPRTGKGVYARRATLKLIQVPEHITIHQFEDACSDFLDSYEDRLINFAHKKHEEPVSQFCHETIKVCTAVDVTPMTDEESGKTQILSDEEKEKAVERALNKLKRKDEEKRDDEL
ncbi:unnamed protein product [Litomosoides sigmodontis]|uniref:DUF3456 domain-containing protein n=1 Tax=Litomosoides sigmodontis TaxID=42156 RepID=A0A3P6UUC9_LITSI|nr:unnamed protein product [Litomosoides sigmodontis]